MGGRGAGTGRSSGSTSNSNIRVGSTVSVANSGVNSRVGRVVSINGDVATVRFGESGTNMPRTDQYYLSDLRIR